MTEHSTLPILGAVHHGPDTMPPTTCLNENEILAFVQGLWENEQLARLHGHLDECDTCQRLVAEAALAMSAPTSVREVEASTTFQRGDLVGQRYLIMRFIARGGMGEVYEAFDRTLKERLALKTVTSSVCHDTHAINRLKAEAQLARRVSHPNVCRIYDFGTHTVEGTNKHIHFLTMELIRGERLGDRIRADGPLSLPDAHEIARQVLLGLIAAHRADILHRDLKSDNVMLRESTAEPIAVVMDFGLARALDAETARLTTGGNQGLVGTIAFMAPEQMENRPLTAAADLYSFGTVWFEMLTGSLPFAGTTFAASAFERWRRSPPPPSSLNPEVPKALDAIVLRCLSRSPEDRFATGEELLQALDSLGEPSYDAQQRSGRRWAIVGAIAGVLSLCAWRTWNIARSHVPKSETLASRERADALISELATNRIGPSQSVPVEMPARLDSRAHDEAPKPPSTMASSVAFVSVKHPRSATPAHAPLSPKPDTAPIRSESNQVISPPPPAGKVSPDSSSETVDGAEKVGQKGEEQKRPDWENPFRDDHSRSELPAPAEGQKRNE